MATPHLLQIQGGPPCPVAWLQERTQTPPPRDSRVSRVWGTMRGLGGGTQGHCLEREMCCFLWVAGVFEMGFPSVLWGLDGGDDGSFWTLHVCTPQNHVFAPFAGGRPNAGSPSSIFLLSGVISCFFGTVNSCTPRFQNPKV